MYGINELRSEYTKKYIIDMLSEMYDPKIYESGEHIEDIVLFTDRRDNYPNIGTDSIQVSVMKYIIKNCLWLNVCMFVNDDFRACIDDAIAIEKALIKVNDQEYTEFRDDMTLKTDEAEIVSVLNINIDNFNKELATSILNGILSAERNIKENGVSDVYMSMMEEFDSKVLTDVRYIVNNYVYLINAMNRNGVFNKYMRLVIDMVVSQLSN